MGLFLTFQSSLGFSQLKCGAFSHSADPLKAPFEKGGPKHEQETQEQVWGFLQNQQVEPARKLTEHLKSQLKTLESREWRPKGWELLSTKSNLHKVYKIPLDAAAAVVKESSRPTRIEPLVYQIAELLRVPTPVLLSLQIGDKQVSAQIFLSGWQTVQSLNQGDDQVQPNLLLTFFDYLIVNSDRNSGNYMVPSSGREAAVDQVAIDHEFAFNADDPGQILKQAANPFLLENLEAIKRNFPEAHEALKDPDTREKILSLIRRASITKKAAFLEHMERGLRAYENIDRLLSGLEPRG